MQQVLVRGRFRNLLLSFWEAVSAPVCYLGTRGRRWTSLSALRDWLRPINQPTSVPSPPPQPASPAAAPPSQSAPKAVPTPAPSPVITFKPLEPPAIHYLHAAEGWMGLGDAAAAQEELAHIPILLRAHPDVLQVRWEICAAKNDWLLALDLARTITKLAPDRRLGWVRLAQSLHRLGRTEEAAQQLLCVVDNLSQNSVVPYHLARFFCALSRPAQARVWLQRALHVAQHNGEVELLRRRISDDPHLERIWKDMEVL